MVAHYCEEVPPSAVGDDVLYEVADARARSLSWEAAAARVGWDVAELRRALRGDPHFDAALERATREVEDEAQAEGLQRLRLLLRDEDPGIALDASKVILKYAAERRRDETRLAVEKLRAEGRAARAAAKAAEEDDEPQLTPAQEKQWNDAMRRNTARAAREASAPGVTAYLWGGRHGIVGVGPDGTDTPVVILEAEPPPGAAGPMYWALPLPLAADPMFGPFPRE